MLTIHFLKNHTCSDAGRRHKDKPNFIYWAPKVSFNSFLKILIRFKIKIPTLKEKLLSNLVGIHGTFLEHCINVFFTVIARDLLDVLDRHPHTARNWSPKRHTANLRNTKSQTLREKDMWAMKIKGSVIDCVMQNKKRALNKHGERGFNEDWERCYTSGLRYLKKGGVELRYSKLLALIKNYFTFYSSYEFP